MSDPLKAKEWIVRKTVDNSGDYPFPNYDVIALHEYGPEHVAYCNQNPCVARLIAASPELVEACEAVMRMDGEAIKKCKQALAKAKDIKDVSIH